jgi:DNA-binding CsgD family transcriptional regulator
MILTTLSNISMNSDQPTWDFTSRELQIISYIQSGNSTKEIAESLNLSAFTIKKHRENIARKIGCSGKSDFRKAVFQYKSSL